MRVLALLAGLRESGIRRGDDTVPSPIDTVRIWSVAGERRSALREEAEGISIVGGIGPWRRADSSILRRFRYERAHDH